jgi:hypothetical protein
MACAWDNCIQQFVSEQKEPVQPLEMNAFWNEFIRQTTENWQSGFLQLAWQKVDS